jgi:hypothetical protein
VKLFLLGAVSTLAVLTLGLVLALGSLGSAPSGSAPAPSALSGPAGPAPAPPDLADDETWLGSVQLRGEDVVSADGDLADVVATGAGIRFSDAGLRAQRLDIDATVPFDTVAGQVGPDTSVYDAGGGRVGVERTVVILGREARVSATGTVVADDGLLLIEPETVDLGGPAFLDAAASAIARGLVTIRQEVPGVPEGMVLTDVTVTPEGFAAALTGTDVVIGP